MDMREYVAAFDQVRTDFEHDVAAFGLPFERRESSPRSRRNEIAARTGCHCENCSASLWRRWISPACLACRTGEHTETFFVSLACNRDCYFCFNPNQVDYEYHRAHRRDIASELESQHAAGARLDYLAVTGGEPLLFKDEVLAFLKKARKLYPHAHTRLYTNGDLLNEATAHQLAKAGLHEIRFSVKPEDVTQAAVDRSATSRPEDPGNQTHEPQNVLDTIAMAVGIIPDVMVEMPVIPGSLEEMEGLLLRLDELGVCGINLLEFCFPLANAEAFRERGFELRKNPYAILYNYWYAGGLPIAGSEGECLALLEFAEERDLALGVHYCSLDNKNTGQVYQQNKGFLLDPAFREARPWLDMDKRDHFLKCVKAFGADAQAVADALRDRAANALMGASAGAPLASVADAHVTGGRHASRGHAWEYDATIPQVSFSRSLASEVRRLLPSVELATSYQIVEFDGRAPQLREVACIPDAPAEKA